MSTFHTREAFLKVGGAKGKTLQSLDEVKTLSHPLPVFPRSLRSYPIIFCFNVVKGKQGGNAASSQTLLSLVTWDLLTGRALRDLKALERMTKEAAEEKLTWTGKSVLKARVCHLC